MIDAEIVGSQLYAKLAQLLAPKDSLKNTSLMLLIEPSGKGVDPEDFYDVKNPNNLAKASETIADLVNSIPVPGPTFELVQNQVTKNGNDLMKATPVSVT
jgi:hypothetical protein